MQGERVRLVMEVREQMVVMARQENGMQYVLVFSRINQLRILYGYMDVNNMVSNHLILRNVARPLLHVSLSSHFASETHLHKFMKPALLAQDYALSLSWQINITSRRLVLPRGMI